MAPINHPRTFATARLAPGERPPLPSHDSAIVTLLDPSLDESSPGAFNLLVIDKGQLRCFWPTLTALSAAHRTLRTSGFSSASTLATTLIGLSYTLPAKVAAGVTLLPSGSVANLWVTAKAANRYVLSVDPSGLLCLSYYRRDAGPGSPFALYDRGTLDAVLTRRIAA